MSIGRFKLGALGFQTKAESLENRIRTVKDEKTAFFQAERVGKGLVESLLLPLQCVQLLASGS